MMVLVVNGTGVTVGHGMRASILWFIGPSGLGFRATRGANRCTPKISSMQSLHIQSLVPYPTPACSKYPVLDESTTR